MNKKLSLLISSKLCFFSFCKCRQPSRWQQSVKYTMNVDLNVNTNLVNGTEKLEYSNNSPDKLDKVYFHFTGMLFSPEAKWM